MLKAYKIIVTGIVQGVGFRPTIYRMAYQAGVKGYVRNMGGSEVEIFVEGGEEEIKTFFELLNNKLPPVAKIYSLEKYEVEPRSYNDFKILPSKGAQIKRSIIPPDFSVCRKCLDEVYREGSRWYRYPFNSCVYCGPRYTIMYRVPYDRENTSMNEFPLCGKCREDYREPNNIRRFHAQGISCRNCGPKVWLVDRDGEEIDTEDPIRDAAKLINEGYIVSIKGIGGFHIAASAVDDQVVYRLRVRKKRPQKPFAIMARDIDTLAKIVHIDDKAIEVLESPEKPILLLPKKEDGNVSGYVAPGLKHLGVFLPYTPLHSLLLDEINEKFAIMTSGNPPGEPMCIKNGEALRKLREIVDYHLLHNRQIVNRVDDSVLRFTDNQVTFLRRGRGYAPSWIPLKFNLEKEVIAFGAMLQNTGGIGFEDKAVITQYIGDCDDLRTLLDLKIYIRRLVKMYRVNIEKAVLVTDLHPLYPTQRLVEELADKYGNTIIKVQHHWAHITSVMAENNLEKVVGIAIDGVGYGPDGSIWGGEVLKAGIEDYTRIGHLNCFPLPGGDLAVKYPIRSLIGILSQYMPEDELVKYIIDNPNLRRDGFAVDSITGIIRQIRDSVKTSSLGRTLDAVSTLLGVCYIRTYEGEPAIKLEAYAERGRILLEPRIRRHNDVWIVDTPHLFQQLIEYLEEDIDKRVLAYNIQYILGYSLADIAVRYADDKIAVSGGAAVNGIIIKGIRDRCEEEDVSILLNRLVPPGDGGISLGQIYISYGKEYGGD